MPTLVNQNIVQEVSNGVTGVHGQSGNEFKNWKKADLEQKVEQANQEKKAHFVLMT
ncbi:MAG: hypothetical protein IPH82_19725 [Chloroflexi bacterium]|nr:hypothetical protein [Chloroflexota bacterium]